MSKLIAIITLTALVAVSNGRPTVPQTFPLVETVDNKPKTLPLVVPVTRSQKNSQMFEDIGSTPPAPKTFPLKFPQEPKNLPVIIPVNSVPKDYPLFEDICSTSLPKTFPLIEQVGSKTKTMVRTQSGVLPLITAFEISNANNHLGLSLLKNLNEDNQNIFFSPFSLSTALTMLYSGAKGLTAQQIRQVLGFENENLLEYQVMDQYSRVLKDLMNMEVKSKENSMKIVNKIVVQKGLEILESFKDGLKENFYSSVEEVNFNEEKSIQDINEWVSKQTNDKIKKLLDEPIDPNTKMVLLNAIYFKGVLQTKFDEKQTEEEVFFGLDNQQKTTKMMKRTGKFNFTEIPELDSTLIEIPYTGHDISLFVVLPNERQGLKRLVNDINDWSVIDSAIDNLRQTKVEVTLPKFKLETSYSMKDKLSSMGMSSVFGPSADLSEIDGKRDLEVEEVFHKSFVEVNEEGTEASSATGVVVLPMAIPEPLIPEFRADHPFMFFIRDNINQMNLFIGQINRL